MSRRHWARSRTTFRRTSTRPPLKRVESHHGVDSVCDPCLVAGKATLPKEMLLLSTHRRGVDMGWRSGERGVKLIPKGRRGHTGRPLFSAAGRGSPRDYHPLTKGGTPCV